MSNISPMEVSGNPIDNEQVAVAYDNEAISRFKK